MNVICRHISNALRPNMRNVDYSTFSSHISLKRLYPGSNINLFTPQFQKEGDNGFSGLIPVDQLQITFSRSSGPGGQNVNMVNTKVDVRFHVETANWINDDLKKKIFLEHKTKITKDGFLVVRSEKTRSQQLNLADALERIRAMIWKLTECEPVTSPETEQRILRHNNEVSLCSDSLKYATARPAEDELNVYLSEVLLPPDANVLSYLKNKVVSPNLRKSALQYLCIPPAKVFPDRLISTAGLICFKKRNRMDPEKVKMKEKANRIRLAEKRTRSRIKQDRQSSVVDM